MEDPAGDPADIDLSEIMGSGNLELFKSTLANMPPDDPDIRDRVFHAARIMFGFCIPEMYGVLFETEYFPNELISSVYGDEFNEFEKFIHNIITESFVSRGDQEPNMDYILGTFKVIDENIEGGLAGYTTIDFTLEDSIDNPDYIGYPVHIPEIEFNILNLFMGRGSCPSGEHPKIFMEFVESGVSIPDIAIHEVTRIDMPRGTQCECEDSGDGCGCMMTYVTELITCNLVGKLILMGWIDTLKMLHETMPDVVMTGLDDAPNYLEKYGEQIERWKVETLVGTDTPLFEYFSDINFYGIFSQMRDFVKEVRPDLGL